VKFGDGLAVSGGGGFESLIERHGIRAGGVLLAAERAKAAGRNANVGGIDVPIDVEIRLVTMHALADMVGHPTHGENIAGAVERERILAGETHVGLHFVENRLQPGVVGLESVRGWHPFDDIAAACVKSQRLRDTRLRVLYNFASYEFVPKMVAGCGSSAGARAGGTGRTRFAA